MHHFQRMKTKGFRPLQQLETELQEPNSFEVAHFCPIRSTFLQTVLIFYSLGRIFEIDILCARGDKFSIALLPEFRTVSADPML